MLSSIKISISSWGTPKSPLSLSWKNVLIILFDTDSFSQINVSLTASSAVNIKSRAVWSGLSTIESIRPLTLCSSDIIVYPRMMSLNGTFNSTLSRSSVVRLSDGSVVDLFFDLPTTRIWKHRCWTIVLAHRRPNHWAQKRRKRQYQQQTCRCLNGFIANCVSDVNRMDLRTALLVYHWVIVILAAISSVEIVCCKPSSTPIVTGCSLLFCTSARFSFFSMPPLFQINTRLPD